MYKGQLHKLQGVLVPKAQNRYFSGCIHYSSQLLHTQVKPQYYYECTPPPTLLFQVFSSNTNPQRTEETEEDKRYSNKEIFPNCNEGVKGSFNLYSQFNVPPGSLPPFSLYFETCCVAWDINPSHNHSSSIIWHHIVGKRSFSLCLLTISH